MPKRNTVFAPAIAALESDLADHEHQAAETRALIKALTAYAGIAGKQRGATGGAGGAIQRRRQAGDRADRAGGSEEAAA